MLPVPEDRGPQKGLYTFKSPGGGSQYMHQLLRAGVRKIGSVHVFGYSFKDSSIRTKVQLPSNSF